MAAEPEETANCKQFELDPDLENDQKVTEHTVVFKILNKSTGLHNKPQPQSCSFQQLKHFTRQLLSERSAKGSG